tara:strand:+ start:232 stop:705 length:474 start_codon:yes stop_codon:yes gene_type:complete
MGGGILPVAIHKGNLYFLFSREYINSKDDGGLWSDFGGSKEKNETFFQTALREGYEESDKIIGSKNNIKNLMENSLQEITINGYRTYVVLIDYNKGLPKKFRKKFLYIKENKPHLLCKKGLYEKDMIKWYSYNDIKKNFNGFRPFYKNIVRTILQMF